MRSNVEDIFDLNGRYGRVNWFSCITFVLAIVLETPFMNTSLYVGPVAQYLNGVDLAWLVGLAFPASAYYFYMKTGKRNALEATVANANKLSKMACPYL